MLLECSESCRIVYDDDDDDVERHKQPQTTRSHVAFVRTANSIDDPLGYHKNQMWLDKRIEPGWNAKEYLDEDSVPPAATACWVYAGSLQDPLTGHVISSVQGVELVQGAASFQDSNDDEHTSKSSSRSRF
jgi:hypothetical protein